jgi:hypothetical protein
MDLRTRYKSLRALIQLTFQLLERLAVFIEALAQRVEPSIRPQRKSVEYLFIHITAT